MNFILTLIKGGYFQPVNDTSIPDAYNMFRMYTVTDFDRSQEERVADLMVHWEIGDHDENAKVTSFFLCT